MARGADNPREYNLRCNLFKDIAKVSAREGDAQTQNDFLLQQETVKYLSQLCVKVIAQDEEYEGAYKRILRELPHYAPFLLVATEDVVIPEGRAGEGVPRRVDCHRMHQEY